MEYLNTVTEYINPYYVGAWVVFHYLTFRGACYLSNYVHNQDDPRYEKYAPFKRHDLKNWNTLACFPWWLTFWPRFITIALIVITYCCWIQLIMLGHK